MSSGPRGSLQHTQPERRERLAGTVRKRRLELTNASLVVLHATYGTGDLPQRREILQCLSFCACLCHFTPHDPLQLICVVTKGRTSFAFTAEYHPLRVYTSVFFHSPSREFTSTDLNIPMTNDVKWLSLCAYPLGRHVYSDLLPFFKVGSLSLNCVVVTVIMVLHASLLDGSP